jgi:dihydroorotate dehydrogenase subfamily 1
MVDISINVAGVKFDNPLFAASGQATNFGEKIKKLALEGKPGGVFTKSVSVDTGQKWGRGAKQPTPLCWPWMTGKGRLGMNVICAKGEPYTCDDWFETEMAIGLKGGVPIIPSVSGSSNLAEWAYLAPNFEQAGAVMLELNFGTPHAGPWEHGAVHLYSGRGLDILKHVRKLVNIPLIIKLPYMSNGPELVKCAKQLVDAGADAFKVCMPAQGMTIDIKTGIPPMGLASRSGILPGPPHKPLAIYNVFTLAEAIKIPIIGSGGVCDGKDVIEYMMAGASGVEICTWMMIKGPKLFHQINKEIKEWMQAKGHRTIEDFRGVSLKYAGIEEYHDNPYSAVVDEEKCTGCGQCETICTWLCQPTLPAAIQVDKKSKTAVVNLEKCIGCGYCFSHCPTSAITLKDWGKRQILKDNV